MERNGGTIRRVFPFCCLLFSIASSHPPPRPGCSSAVSTPLHLHNTPLLLSRTSPLRGHPQEAGSGLDSRCPKRKSTQPPLPPVPVSRNLSVPLTLLARGVNLGTPLFTPSPKPPTPTPTLTPTLKRLATLPSPNLLRPPFPVLPVFTLPTPSPP